MKPIILVIVGGAMLLLTMHQNTNSENDELLPGSKEYRLHSKVQEKKQDSDMLMHNVSMWLERLQ